MRKTIIAAALIVWLMPGAALPQAKSGNSGVYEQLNLFGEAFERIRHDAVEPVADGKLVESAITGMLAGLDPHSVYLSPTEYKALQNRTPDESATTGLVVTLENGQLKVVAPRDGSPAAEADIKPGDIIFSIDKEPTYDLTLPEIEQKLHGAAGSEVALMLRRGTEKPIDIKIKRVAGEFPTVSHRLEAGDIGYIRLSGFDAGTADQLSAAVADLRQQGGSKLIGFVLDLRNNPGGNFDAAVKAADAFLDKGDITVLKSRKSDSTKSDGTKSDSTKSDSTKSDSTKSDSAKSDSAKSDGTKSDGTKSDGTKSDSAKSDVAKHVAATPGDVAKGQPIVALVNGGTAREAELVAGALQDNKRAVLIGGKTFGESAIETVIPLPGDNAGAIRLTTSRFLTPTGRPIQGKGLEPDLTVSPLKLEKLAQGDRRREADLRGALKNPDAQPATPGSTPAGKTAPDKTSTTATPPKGDQPTVASGDIGTQSDEQLSEAVDVLRGLALVSGRTASAAR